MSSCPSLAELEGLVSGSSGAELREHVAGCAACETTVAELRSNLSLEGHLRGLRRAELPPPEPAALVPPPGYQLLGLLGEGAQGAVYRAAQEATRRTVAIKFLHQGAFPSARQRRRFEREIDLAANLRHPGIVTVHESGTTPAGQLYCVMEYVDGVPIDEAVRRQARGPRAVVDLFVQVCDAVHHAHQHGVLHRDLKPGNVFVDGQGQPRVLDFGLARTLAAEEEGAPPASLATRTGEFLGTFAYASPEQVEVDPQRIDVRSDVYSLGVILYELLAGRRPYEVTGSVAASVQAILHAVPVAPGKRGAATDRDLDTIVLRALAKDRERRYGSAADLARDLRAWREGRPIDARRDSTLYVLRKTVRRHWLASSGVAAVLVVSVAAAVVSNHYRGVADDVAAKERESAEAAARKARESERVRTLLETLITANDPERAFGRDPTVREILERAGPEILADLDGEPLVQAALQLTIGRAYASLHDAARAEGPLAAALATYERAEGAEHPDTLLAMSSLLALRIQQARYDEAEALAQDALGRLERGGREGSRPAADVWGFASTAALGRTDLPEALARARRCQEILESLPDPDPVAVAMAEARCARLLGVHEDLAGAEALMHEALDTLREHRSRHPAFLIQTLVEAQELARLRRGYEDSAQLLEEAHALCAQLYGAEDSYTLRLELAKLEAEWRAHDFRADAPEVEEAYAKEELLAGRADPDALEALVTLANFASSAYDLPRAERLSRLVVDACDARGTPDAPIVQGATQLLGAALALQWRYAEAEPVLQRSLELGDALFGADTRKTIHKTAALLATCKMHRGEIEGVPELVERSLEGLKPGVFEIGDLLLCEGRVAEFLKNEGHGALAERLARHAFDRLREELGETDSGVAELGTRTAEILRAQGHLEEALDVAYQALEVAEAHPELGTYWVANALREVAFNLGAQERRDEAEATLLESLDLYDALGHPANSYRLGALQELGALRLEDGRFEEARVPLQELVDARRREAAAQPSPAGHALVLLGQCHAAAAEWHEAAAVFEEAVELLARTDSPADRELLESARERRREVETQLLGGE